MNSSNDIAFYEKTASEDLTCPKIGNKPNISSYAIQLGLLRAKWAKFLYIEESLLNEFQQNVNTIYADKFMYYNYDYEYNIDKKDIPIIIKKDADYKSAESQLKAQEQKIKFINEVLNALNSQSFYLNTAMKHILWQSGETA